ncbi:MAG: Bax inhibitor-1 family protein [Bryobacteraceae bacterium]
MNYSAASVTDRLFGSTPLSVRQSSVIRQAYLLLGLAVVSAMAGGYIGATTPAIVGFFASPIGWVAAMILLNVVPWIAIRVRHNPALGVSALVFDGFLGGIALSPLLFYASVAAPGMIPIALAVTGAVFLGVTGYVLASGRTFSAPRGLMAGMFFAVLAAMILNAFLHIGWLGVAVAIGIGAIGVASLVYGTSSVLNSPDADSPIPGALWLYASLFNIFVAVLNLLLRLLADRR